MATKEPAIPAGEFKARCLALLDQVRDSRRSLVVTKRGRPVARIVPVEEEAVLESLKASVLEEGDLVAPVDARWNASS